MGDRCYLSMRYLKTDDEAVVDKLPINTWDDWNEMLSEDDNPVRHGVVYEANYAWWGYIEELARTGISFCGYHDEGGNYAACEFAAYGGKLYAICLCNGDPVVGVSLVDGKVKVNEKELEMAETTLKAIYHVGESFNKIEEEYASNTSQ